MDLSARQKKILKDIIEEYIIDAEPIGSRTLSKKWGDSVSAATIRNEMSELEELGVLEKPHTSAGRIPSALGYRLYINEFLNSYILSLSEIEDINHALRLKFQQLDRLIDEASNVVSRLTNHMTVSIAPRMDQTSIRCFNVVPVDACSFALVAVTNAGIVKSKTVKTQSAASEDDVAVLNHLLNKRLSGIPLSEISADDFAVLEKASARARPLVSEMSLFISEIIGELSEQRVYLGGATRLLNHPEYRDVEKAQKLLDFISDIHNMGGLASQGGNELIKINIGPENKLEPLNDASIVYTTYHLGGGMHGVIGVVGPMRMDYTKVAARLSLFSKGLGRILADCFLNDDKDL